MHAANRTLAMLGIGLCVILMPSAVRPAYADQSQIKEFCLDTEQSDQKYCWLSFRGPISRGDAARLERAIISTGADAVYFDSPGGDALEGIRIGELLNKFLIEMRVLSCFRSETLFRCATERTPFSDTSRCASSCALAYVIADRRRGTEVYLHRPYFEHSAFSKLAADDAKTKYGEMLSKLTTTLRSKGVREDTIKQIIDTPSTHAVRIPDDYPEHSPWFEEWMNSKCPGFSRCGDLIERQIQLEGRDDANDRARYRLAPLSSKEREQLSQIKEVLAQLNDCQIPAIVNEMVARLQKYRSAKTPPATDKRTTKLISSRPIIDTRLPYDEQWDNLGDLLNQRLKPLRAASINIASVDHFGGSTSTPSLRQAKAVARQLEGDFIWGDLGKGLTGLFVHNRSNSTITKLVLRSTDGECESHGKETYFVVSFSSGESLKPSEAALFLTELDYPAGFFPKNDRPDSWCTEIVRAF